ncbi:multiple inositol polyphosphate phosphatase 1-like [Saccostrea cucullata]|uniref:multiple inositol polyphosphate phosphatase 1-like n=1 Tax=Saccostrea cuccullata TaxID=36930 RepID=UPI002ED617EB
MSAFTRTQLLLIILIIFLECVHVIYPLSSFQTASYSTKTPYFWLYNAKETVADDSETWFDYGDKACQVIHLNAVLRHGARYPSLKWIKRMSTLHKKLLENGVDERFPFLRTWTNPFPEESDKIIAELGQQEQELLGERFARRFNLLFDEDMDSVRVVSSSKQRSHASSLAFYSGLSQTVLGEENTIKPEINDIAMRFHDNCVHFSETVDKNKTATSEYSKFKYGPEVADIAKKLSVVLGLPEEAGVTPDDLNTIHQLCAFEEALTESGSQWCQFLNEENLEVIQYMNDLKQYWKKMYGHDISSAMSCPLVSSIFTALDKVIQANNADEDFEAAVFGFGHAETLAPLYAALGLFKDDPQLKADNFKIHQNNRQFRASKVLPFSGNFAVALFQCDSVDEQDVMNDDSEYVVKFYVNEKPVNIPACGKKVCPYDQVRDYYKGQVDKCEFHKMCRNPKQDSKKHEEL